MPRALALARCTSYCICHPIVIVPRGVLRRYALVHGQPTLHSYTCGGLEDMHLWINESCFGHAMLPSPWGKTAVYFRVSLGTTAGDFIFAGPIVLITIISAEPVGRFLFSHASLSAKSSSHHLFSPTQPSPCHHRTPRLHSSLHHHRCPIFSRSIDISIKSTFGPLRASHPVPFIILSPVFHSSCPSCFL